MPAVPKVELLPASVRAELDETLVAQGYGELVAASTWLQVKGYSIGKSAVGDYALALKRRHAFRNVLADADLPASHLLDCAAIAAASGATQEDLFERADGILSWALEVTR